MLIFVIQLSWPLLNVIRSTSLIAYQRVYRLILQVYRVKYVLRNTFLIRGKEPLKHMEIAIRQDLQCFVDTIFSHLVNTILKPGSLRMQSKMASAEDIDQMTEIHDSFILKIQTQCLLTKNLQPIHHAVLSLLEQGVRFADLRRQHLSRVQVPSPSRKPKPQRRTSLRPNRRPISTSSSDSDPASSDVDKDDDDPDYDADTEKLSGNEGSYAQRLRKMKDEVTRLRIFIVTGLRGIARAGGEPTWEMLADQLDWGSFGLGK